MLNALKDTTAGTKVAVQMRPVSDLVPYSGNARTHSRKQIRQIADSITRFGFTNPVLTDDAGGIIAGHGRVAAARLLGLSEVPTICLSHLSPEERRAYVLADNKLAENAGWDPDILAIELQGLVDIGFDLEVTGFSLAEIDIVLDGARSKVSASAGRENMMPPGSEGPTVTRPGDLWQLGEHALICGDAREQVVIDRLTAGETVDLIFTDPPYNVPIDGHVSGLGRVRHGDFAFASGEMAPEAFVAFLEASLGNAARVSRDGAIAFVCMGWRHMGEYDSFPQYEVVSNPLKCRYNLRPHFGHKSLILHVF